LKGVFPAGFGAAQHRRAAKKAIDEELNAFDLSRSIESAPKVVKGKLPDTFSFIQWARGGDAELSEEPKESGKDSYSGVAGQFRRIPSRFSMERPSSRSVNPVREMHLEVDNRHLLRYTNPVVAGITNSEDVNNDDIDTLVENLERDLNSVSRSRVSNIHEDESVVETLSLASAISEAKLVPQTTVRLPNRAHTSLRVEIINLRAYIEAAFAHSEARQGDNKDGGEGEGEGEEDKHLLPVAPAITPPDVIDIPLKLNFVQFKRQIVEMLREKYNMIEAKTSSMVVSYFDMEKQYWRDVSKPLQWEQAKLVARTDDGIVRVGFSLQDIDAETGTGTSSRRSGKGAVSPTKGTGFSTQFNAATLDEGLAEAQSSKAEMEAFIQLAPSPSKPRLRTTSLRLAPRSFQLPSTTMMKAGSRSLGVKPMVDARDKEEEEKRVATMARSLQNKLTRTRW